MKFEEKNQYAISSAVCLAFSVEETDETKLKFDKFSCVFLREIEFLMKMHGLQAQYRTGSKLIEIIFH